MFQEELLPWLNDTTCGPLNEHHKQLISVLGMARIEAFLPGWAGLPGAPVVGTFGIMAQAFVVGKAVFNPYRPPDCLIEMLSVGQDVTLALCGWQRRSEVPSAATFSRAFAEFATSALPSRLHEALILVHHADRLVTGHISRDGSTAIEAREKPATFDKPAPQPKLSRKRGRPRKGEDPARAAAQPDRTPTGHDIGRDAR